jgi:hypothetical protein
MSAGVAGNTSSGVLTRASLSFDPGIRRDPERLVTLSEFTQLSATVRCSHMSIISVKLPLIACIPISLF